MPVGFSLTPAANAKVKASLVTPMSLNLQVLGSGTVGRLTKWTGIASSNSFIGDSTIFEDKLGNVGIGTDTPTSRLTVAGAIQSLSGGFKFPDGTVQTTAGIAPNHVVTSLNGLMGDLTLLPGSNITITPGTNSLTIAASGLLSGVNHDATLTGDGAIGSPLGVNVPLILSGSVDGGVIQVSNAFGGGVGVVGEGGSTNGFRGGTGLFGTGGKGDSLGGEGVRGEGGFGDSDSGGAGVFGLGGSGNFIGGDGVEGIGGSGEFGGNGAMFIGGQGNGPGHPSGHGVFSFAGEGINGAADGLAGDFNGNVQVTGNLSKGGGSFKIDHPLDPQNKYLYHSFVESPDMKNIYDGNVVTDENGEAVVKLPDYFEALNRDFRYQLTVIGAFAQAIVADEMKKNRFTIKTSAPGVKVSWQVTGIRQDAYANKHRIPVEEEKAEQERGHYLHPDAFNQPEEKGIEWAHNPEMMQRLKQTREQLKQKAKHLNQQVEKDR